MTGREGEGQDTGDHYKVLSPVDKAKLKTLSKGIAGAGGEMRMPETFLV